MKRTLIKISAFFFLLSIITLPNLLKPSSEELTWNPDAFKVIAYTSEVPFDEPVETIRYDKLTHIVYAFLIPKSDGSLYPLAKPKRLTELVESAHANNVKVSIALGGWSYEGAPLSSTFEALADNHNARTQLVQNVMSIIDHYHLDGLELDWEYPSPGQSATNYETLVLALDKELSHRKKSFSAAVSGSVTNFQGTSFTNGVSDRCLGAFDWINVMAYDLYGSQHAPFWYAETSITFWANRGMPREKIVLGLPLYAQPSWKQYRHLVQDNPDNAWKDYIPGTPLESWYNGLATLKEKTRMALLSAGGVMLFDVHEDTTDYTSVLNMINTLKTTANQWRPEAFKKEVTCVINNHQINFSPSSGNGIPYINTNNRLMVPIKKSVEALGGTVEYADIQEHVTINLNDNILIIQLKNKAMTLNGKAIPYDPDVTTIGNHLFVPARTLLESLNYRIEWLGDSRTLLIR